jgi:hypothetical protein
MEEHLTMSNKDIDRLKVLHSVMNNKLTWNHAADQLSVSKRHIGRLLLRIKSEGNKGIIHKLRGKPSNNRFDQQLIDTAIDLVKTRYPDFGPSFANEKLFEIHKITISTSTLRKAMIKADIWHPRKQKTKHRQWRQRRACVGELVQLDGSDHDWFEGRGPRCVLLIFIDDATSRILYGQFVSVENTFNLMAATKQYLLKNGRPIAIYVDKDGVYKINRQAAIEEQLKDEQPLTQYSRAMAQLGIEPIFANSPQAKGRVERSFNTHQDRLVKELRLAGISNINAANKFLQKTYIPNHNTRFAVTPANTFNAHRALLKAHNLDEILSVQLIRTLANDFTLRYNNKYLQLLKDQKIRLHPKSKILILSRLDGSLHLKFKSVALNYKSLPKRPYVPFYKANPSLAKAPKTASKPYIPLNSHPWKRNFRIVAAKNLPKLNLSKPITTGTL